MKSQERHELKTHELDKVAALLRSFFKRHGQTILIGFCSVIVVLAIVVFWRRSATTQSARAWQGMIAAVDAESFATVADEQADSGSAVALWARLKAAERHYRDALQLYYTNRAAGREELSLAREAFEAVLQSAEASATIRERALFGLARCKETASGGNTQEAISAYEDLLSEFPETIYRDEAEKRIKALQSRPAQDFYAWFTQQQPKPEDREQPRDGAAAPSIPLNPGGSGTAPFGASGAGPSGSSGLGPLQPPTVPDSNLDLFAPGGGAKGGESAPAEGQQTPEGADDDEAAAPAAAPKPSADANSAEPK